MPRLFTALEIPRNAAMSLSLLRGGLPGARWIDVENYHITLRFIGDVDDRTADEIVERLDRIDRPEFQLRLTGIGSFGSKKPHSVWAGVSSFAGMYALQAEIERICQRIGLPAGSAQVHAACDARAAEILAGRGCRAVTFPVAATSRPSPSPSRASCFFRRANSVGGGPYLTEEVFPLSEAWSAPSVSTGAMQPVKSLA